MKKLMIVACALFLLASCGNSAKNGKTTVDSAAVADSVAASTLTGVYKGEFPAADGPGIQTTLTLNADSTYTMVSSFVDKNTTINDKGTYTLSEGIVILKGSQGELTYFAPETGLLRKLNEEKKPITGPLANHYILNKQK